MYSEFKSFSFMGVSNPEMFLSEKDLNALELNFLARPTLDFEEDHDDECQIAPLQEEEEDDDEAVFEKQEQDQVEEKEKQEEEDKCRILVSSLKIKLPNSLGEFKVEEDEEEDNDGFKTPTSSNHKIPPALRCPPAPRKPKSRPLIITKRKLQPAAAAAHQRKILHDLSNEIEALFPPALLADLGNKIKKVRQEK